MPDEEKLFELFADVLAKGQLAEPENYPTALRLATRNQIRQGAMLWLARMKANGADLFQRHEVLSGKFSAPREVVDQVWHLIRLFGVSPKGPQLLHEKEEEVRASAKRYDEFNKLLDGMDPVAPDYWTKVHAFLGTEAHHKGVAIKTVNAPRNSQLRSAVLVAGTVLLAALIALAIARR
jgi:hypothetical protein